MLKTLLFVIVFGAGNIYCAEVELENIHISQPPHTVTQLDLCGRKDLTDLAFLENYPNLTYLNIAGCEGIDLRQLGVLTKLVELDMEYVPYCYSGEFFKQLPNLRKITYSPDYTTLETILEATSLEEIIMRYSIYSVEQMQILYEKLPNLKRVTLYR